MLLLDGIGISCGFGSELIRMVWKIWDDVFNSVLLCGYDYGYVVFVVD